MVGSARRVGQDGVASVRRVAALTLVGVVSCFHPTGSETTGSTGTDTTADASSAATTGAPTTTTTTTTTTDETTTATGSSTSDTTCGDGVVDPNEECDDGDVDDTDECVHCKAAVCGDGHVRAGQEVCDDGNATEGDGCTQCVLDHFVFVTDPAIVLGDITIVGADAVCQMTANASRVPIIQQRASKFVAWLSTVATPAPARLLSPQGAYYLPMGEKVFDALNSLLLVQTLLHPIDQTASGTTVTPVTTGCGSDFPQHLVWTGTFPDGTSPGDTCGEWTNQTLMAVVGDLSQKNYTWTNACSPVLCSKMLRLYCFEKA